MLSFLPPLLRALIASTALVCNTLFWCSLLFLFAIGYKTGPQFFSGLKSSGLPQTALTVFLCGTGLGVAWALVGGFAIYGVLKAELGLRLSAEEEYDGADLSIHKIGATPDREVSW